MDDAMLAQWAAEDEAASKEHRDKTAVMSGRIKTLVTNYLSPARARVETLRARIEKAEKHQDSTPGPLWSEYDSLMDEVETLYDYLYSIVASALSWRYSADEIKGWYVTAVEKGCVRPKVGKALIEDLMYVRKVPNAPFRAVVQEMVDNDIPMPDSMKTVLGSEPLRRIVGIEPHCQPGAVNSLRLYVTYEQGVALARLLGMTPQQAGV